MSSPTKTQVRKKSPSKKPRKCGGCGQNGHDRRNCPVNPRQKGPKPAPRAVVDHNAVAEGLQTPPLAATVVTESSSINWERVLYVIFELETTGRSRQNNEIIEIAAQVFDPFGVHIEDADCCEFVKPKARIPPCITGLTTNTDAMVSRAEGFSAVCDAFIRFMQQTADDFSSLHDNQPRIDNIIWIAHNGKAFDIPFFMQQLSKHPDMSDKFLADTRFKFAIDTMVVARNVIKNDPSKGIPSNFKLSTLYEFVAGRPPNFSHRARTLHVAKTTTSL